MNTKWTTSSQAPSETKTSLFNHYLREQEIWQRIQFCSWFPSRSACLILSCALQICVRKTHMLLILGKNKVEDSHFILSEINSKLSLDSNHTTYNHTSPKFGILVQPKCLLWRSTRLSPFVSEMTTKKQNCTFTWSGLLVHLMWVEE